MPDRAAMDVLRPIENLTPHPPATPATGGRRPRGASDKENAKERIVVLRAGGLAPSRPSLPRHDAPPSFRLRRYGAAPTSTKSAFQVARAQPAYHRSRSSPHLSTTEASRQLSQLDKAWIHVLPANMMQRARSSPMLQCTSMPRTTSQAGALGESLSFSSAAYLQSSYSPSKIGLGVPAARIYFDPATGREIALRAC